MEPNYERIAENYLEQKLSLPRKLSSILMPLFIALGIALLPSLTGAQTIPLAAEISRKATLGGEGATVDVSITVTCASGHTVLEAFLYVVQAGNQSTFAGIPVVCDDQPHTFDVRVSSQPDAPIHRGKASVSGYILVQDPATGATESVNLSQKIVVR